MTTTKVAYSESDYCRMWNTYWKFCWQTRHNKFFFIQLLSGFIFTTVLLSLAHPEKAGYSVPVLLGIILCILPLTLGFDYLSYKRHQKRWVKFYREHQPRLDYELKFDAQDLFFSGRKISWNLYRFYYIAEQDIYIFKNRHELALIWSANSMDKESFVELIVCAKNRLKILPAARGIVIKQSVFTSFG